MKPAPRITAKVGMSRLSLSTSQMELETGSVLFRERPYIYSVSYFLYLILYNNVASVTMNFLVKHLQASFQVNIARIFNITIFPKNSTASLGL